MSAVEAIERIRRISPEDLNDMLERPDLVILDVRKNQDWEQSDEMIEGAIAEDPQHPEKWMGRYSRNLTYVLY
jgi:rhodanese-related sulfurtransferase